MEEEKKDEYDTDFLSRSSHDTIHGWFFRFSLCFYFGYFSDPITLSLQDPRYVRDPVSYGSAH